MKIKVVDGNKIRNTIDIDFSVIGNHDLYPYIDKGVVWFDKAFIKEKDFFVKLFADRLRLTKKYGYEKAKAMLRSRVKPVKLEALKIKLIEQDKGLKIFLVNGAIVRQSFDPSFCFGGHWLVYNYILKNEVWLDNVVVSEEQKYVLIHELYELNLMKKGKDYNNAHDFACAAEKEARRGGGVGIYIKD